MDQNGVVIRPQGKKDFIIRNSTLSDQAEVMNLCRQYGDLGLVDFLATQFELYVSDEQTLLKVALNSNGVVVGFLWCHKNEWKTLVINPNFRKKELKTQFVNEARIWAQLHSPQRVLEVKPKSITGDLKAFIKREGVKLELLISGKEQLQF